jgi:itaconyl-CoA hydratase
MNGLPLDGITVVAIEQAAAAPFATRQLADLGARVIKIESQNVFANLGWEKVTLPHPVFEGDTIRSRSTVQAVRESASRPGLGVVSVSTTGLKQTGEVVIEFTRTLLVYKRGHGPRAETVGERAS